MSNVNTIKLIAKAFSAIATELESIEQFYVGLKSTTMVEDGVRMRLRNLNHNLVAEGVFWSLDVFEFNVEIYSNTLYINIEPDSIVRACSEDNSLGSY